MSADDRPLLSVRNLEKHYPITRGLLNREVGRTRAVDGISFDVDRGETLGIVGESGCGKSTAAMSMVRLEEPTGGEIEFDGRDVRALGKKELRKFRREVQFIFQDPNSSFDPRMNVGEIVEEPLRVQGMNDKQRRRDIVGDLLERVGLSKDDMRRFPHEFSGGQKQRIGLARALSVNPSLIVADEPVSALDVSVQSEILRLIKDIQEDFGLTILLISHDLAVVRELCDRVAVMYLGEFVEVGETETLFSDPQHPYTRALLSAIPTPDPSDRGLGKELTGDVPDPSNPPSGCRFHTRCPEIIQPDGVDLPQQEWRNVMDFRQQVDKGSLDLDAIVEVHAIESGEYEDIDAIEFEEIDDATLAGWLRDEYELPTQLSDPTADVAVEHALNEIADRDLEAASEAMGEDLTTVCEQEDPPLEPHGSEGHLSACHLNDPAMPGSPEHAVEEPEAPRSE